MWEKKSKINKYKEPENICKHSLISNTYNQEQQQKRYFGVAFLCCVFLFWYIFICFVMIKCLRVQITLEKNVELVWLFSFE